MNLPNAEQAWIHPDKILKYLLSDTHKEGKEKANFLRRFGFRVESWEVLAGALRQHATDNEVTRIVEERYGFSYVVEGPLSAPDGRTPHIRSVWMIDKGASIPRLITAYPLGKSHDDSGI